MALCFGTAVSKQELVNEKMILIHCSITCAPSSALLLHGSVLLLRMCQRLHLRDIAILFEIVGKPAAALYPLKNRFPCASAHRSHPLCFIIPSAAAFPVILLQPSLQLQPCGSCPVLVLPQTQHTPASILTTNMPWLCCMQHTR